MAIGGESESRGNGSNKPNPLPSLAVSCAHNEMVRRGSTVRVRQRALEKASKWPFLLPRRDTERFSTEPQPVPNSSPHRWSLALFELEQRGSAITEHLRAREGLRSSKTLVRPREWQTMRRVDCCTGRQHSGRELRIRSSRPGCSSRRVIIPHSRNACISSGAKSASVSGARSERGDA